MSDKKTITEPTGDQLVAIHKLMANCFVASIGTVGNPISKAEISSMASKVNDELKKPEEKPLLDIWKTALDQARDVLVNDSIANRLSRSAQLVGDVIPLAARAGLTMLVTTSNKELLPPLPFKADTVQSTKQSGRCE